MNKGQFRKGFRPWNAGTHLSGMSGKHQTAEHKAKIGAANKKSNPKSSQSALLRRSPKFKEWRLAVFEKDNYTCQKCGANKQNNKWIILHPHHIKSFANFPELRFVVGNGQTLCEACHGGIHDIDFNGYHRKLVCAICNQTFKPKYGNYSIKTCSRKCGYIFRSQHGSSRKGKHYPHLQRAKIVKCPECGLDFRAIKDTVHRKQKYCSQTCYLEARWDYTGKKAVKLNGHGGNSEN